MTSKFLKLLGLTIIVILQAGCRPNDAHQVQRGGDGSETFKFDPKKKYAPTPPKTREEEKENSTNEKN